jgi:hypothetical protein
MSLKITHAFVSSRPDGTDTTQVQPSNWNADHIVSGSDINPVLPSTTPIFDCSLGDTQKITLTANAVATVINISQAQRVLFEIIQDGFGSQTFTWPSNVFGGMTISSTANSHNIQYFYSPDGVNLLAVTPGNTVLI